MRKILLLTVVVLSAITYGFAQERTVSGRVTATEDGTPLPGVNVVLKGTSSGTATDADGRFSLSIPQEGGALVFSFIGLESKEIAIGDRSVVDVSLALDVTQLSEVVVTALGVEKDTKTLGFSVEKVTNEELTVGRTTNVVNALAGKVAGVRVAGSNGMTGSSSAIFIRGFTTFTGSNQPLFVIDGIPIDNGGGAMALQTGVSNSNRAIDINQDDIESLTVLKGPAAAVLYGSRAAAGAIIITTKKGKSGVGKKLVEYTGSYNVLEPNRFPDYQNEYARGSSLNSSGVPIAPVYQPNADQSNWGPIIAGQSVASPYSAADQTLLGLPATETLTAYPNNVEDMFRDGYNAQHNLSFSGGGEKSNFYFSYNNLKDKGYMEGNQLDRNSFRFNGSSQITSKFNMGITANYINSVSERSQTGNQLSNPLFRGWFLPRDYDLKNSPWIKPDGSQIFFNANTDHPYWTLRKNLYDDELNRMIGTVSMGYDFTDWLGVNYRIGTDLFTLRRNTYDAIGARGQANHAVQGVGAIGERTTYNQQTSSYLTLNLKKQLTEDINLTALVGNEINLQVSSDYGFTGNTLNTRDFRRITDATNFVPLATTDTRRNLVGVFADIQGSYKGFLFLGLTGRNDWSSTFKKGNNSYFYPSVTSSVILTEMVPALKSNIVNFAKIKANWAKVGREADLYSTDTYFNTSNPADGFGPQIIYPFQSQLGRTLGNTAGNAELGPEFTRSYEVGLEARFWQDRISIDLTYFNTHSTDIILDVPIAAASGFTSQTRNAGVLETNGIEFTLGATVLKVSGFQWNIDLNWSRIRNNVISLADGVQNIAIGGFTTAQTRIEAGKEYGIIYANSLTRDAEGRIIVSSTTGLPSNGPAILRGNPNPRWTGGITNTMSYKGITLSFLVDIRHGGDILSRVINDVRRTGSAIETAEIPRFNSDGLTPAYNYIVDGVYADGTPNAIPVTSQQYFESMFAFANPGEGVFDASWVRLREASLFYSLPKSLLEKTPFGRVEIGLNGRNLLLKTDVPHIDPETNLTGATNSQGLEFNTMPNARSYGAVIKFTF